MAEYIDKAVLIAAFSCDGSRFVYDDHVDAIISRINVTPTADVAPVVHGKWMVKQIDSFRKFEITCSVCGWTGIDNYDSYDDPADYNYCPNCGAKMDLEE